MKSKAFALVVFLMTCLLLALAVRPSTQAAPLLATDELPVLEVIKSVSVDSGPDAMILRCEGAYCGRYNELVYWGQDRNIYFLDLGTLTPMASPLATDLSALARNRYLFYDRFYQQIYAVDRESEGSYPNSWYRVEARIIRGFEYADSVPINEDDNMPTPVDRYYPIDGAALLQPLINTGSVAKIYVDNPVNGNVDVVTFAGNVPEDALSTRFSYRLPLGCASGNSCSWHENSGSSLAVDGAGTVYIADNNDLIDQIVVHQPNGNARPPIANVGSLFPCFVDETGISAVAGEDVLYLPAGCQSFADGAVALLDTSVPREHRVVELPYKDQDFVTVDWFDPKRAFVATADFAGQYDPARSLYLHLLYDGQLIASLPITSNYERRSLGAMVFDPYRNMLYLAVDTTLFVVQVNYGGTAGFPPLPDGEKVVTPDADHDLIARDSSAIFQFNAGAVDGATRVSYRELPPTGAPAGTLRVTQGDDGTVLRTIRQFELTAVDTITGAPVTQFNSDYQLQLYYSRREAGPIIGGNSNMGLYRWDGSSWQPVGSTYGSPNEDLLTIYADLTGQFAILGPTYPNFLPSILK